MQPIAPTIKPDDSSPAVINLQDALLALFEHQIFKIFDAPNSPTRDDLQNLTEQLKQERARPSYDKGTTQLVRYFQLQQGLGDMLNGVVEEKTAAKLNDILKSLRLLDSTAAAIVQGIIALEQGFPASRVNLMLYHRGFGGARTLLGKAITNLDGNYTIPYSIAGAANIEIVALDTAGNEVQLSQTKFGAQPNEHIDLVAPDRLQVTASEFTRLKAAVAPHTNNNPTFLKDAVERPGRRDFSFLAGVSDWDAGALALAAEAFDGEHRTQIPAEAIYALARAGMPNNIKKLAHIAPQTIAAALQQAANAGIIDAGIIATSLQAHAKFAADYKLNNRIPGALSSAKDFATKARLAEVDRAAFNKTLQDGTEGDLWERAKAAGVSDGGIETLQLQGKLAYLTFNNAELCDFLISKIDNNVLTLIDLDYYEEATWKETLLALADDDSGQLAALIPPMFGGLDNETRLQEYAGELARRVRQMDTHAVTIKRIAKGAIGGIEEKDNVSLFLNNATAVGFRLGKTPLSAFLAKNDSATWSGIAEEKKEAVLASVRTLSTLYAASPSDEALHGLLSAGFRSATAIASYDYLTFKDRLRPFLTLPVLESVSQQVYWKAQQQSSTVFNVFEGYKRLESTAYAPVSTEHDVKKRDDQTLVTRDKLIGLFPTLETLFGSVDYCECSQCQSVLSPAAYLVDILHFLDPSDEAWASMKGAFKARTGSDYTKQKPFDALNLRRPDIKNIALTCENTNTTLPYIDIVNQILEQLVTSSSLPIEAYNVGDVASADLIAEPQNILWDAYIGSEAQPRLREAVYPLTLPFDLPLEMGRAFLNQLGFPLWKLRELLARPTTLTATAVGQTNGWSDVWLERLGLGKNDIEVLTRNNKWYELFGYDSEAEALKTELVNSVAVPAKTSVLNGKTLSRQLDVSYKELLELIRTRFINPEIENLIVLNQLGIDPQTLDRYLGGSPAMSPDEKASFESELTSKKVSGVQLAPLRSKSIRQVTLVLQSPTTSSDFAQTTLAFDLDSPAASANIILILRKLNAMVRLQKKLGWDIHELDRVLMALMPSASTITLANWPDAINTALIYLAHVEELRERFTDRVSREEISVLWSDIPYVGLSSLYERLFLAPGALGHDTAFDKFLGHALSNPMVRLSDHREKIQQVMQLTHDDIESILQTAGSTDRQLSIKNLSLLIRYAVLAKGLDCSTTDLLTLLNLSQYSPLSPLDGGVLTDLNKDVPWSETLAFVDEFDLMSLAGVGVSFIEQICHGRNPEEVPDADKDPVMLSIAGLPSPGSISTDKWQTLLIQTLAAQLSSSEAMIGVLLGSLLLDATQQPLKIDGFTADNRINSLRKLRTALNFVASLNINVAELTHLANDPACLKLNDLPLAEVVSDDAARNLKKSLSGWLELVAARRQFGRSERLLTAMAAANQPVDANNTFALREQQLQQALMALTDLKLPGLSASLEAVGATSSPGTTYGIPQLQRPAILQKTVAALKCITKLGLNPKDVVQFANTAITDTVAQKLHSSVKHRYTASAWRSLARPIFDGLRKKQRDALVAVLTRPKNGLPSQYGDTTEQLFEYLLLDPGMEPVVLASPIQLATLSVQLFVQRCLMDMEGKTVDSQIIDKQRWEWMRRYRVWEVNRKMFIWTENWLDPEFRDDKTHLFRELESKLLQGDVNEDLVRSALHRYLKGLEEIARIDMLTMYFEPGASADSSVIHVVGRTPHSPYKYFYRNVASGMWTPWEPIDIGIEGEHLVLTSWRGRLYLFWLSFIEQGSTGGNLPDKFAPGKDTVDTSKLGSISQVKLQLHWVEQVQNSWVNRNSTQTFVGAKFEGCKATTDEDKRKLFVRAVTVENGAGIEDDNLEIHISQGSLRHKYVFFSKLAAPRSESIGNVLRAPPFNASVGPRGTKWHDAGPLQVNFVSTVTQSDTSETQLTGGGAHPILNKGDGLALLFPSNETLPIPSRSAPAGVGRPSGYVFGPQNTQHVAYRTSDGSIIDLFFTAQGWFQQSPSLDAASINTFDEPEAAISDPHAYPLNDLAAICIAYSGSTKIHELVWSQLDASWNDPHQLATGWHIDTLYVAASRDDQPIGRPFGGLFQPARGVVFRTIDGHLRSVVMVNGSWQIQDLNTNLPKAKSDPTGALISKTDQLGTHILSRHIAYLGEDGDVHELRSDVAGQIWTHTNITGSTGAIVKPKPGSIPAMYAFLGQNTLHVVYQGTDDHIHELWGFSGSWNYNASGALFTKAKGDPTGYVTEKSGMQHVLYRGEGDEVVEMWWYGIWRENVLTKAVPSAPKALADVTGYSFEAFGSQHVVYFSTGGTPQELWWSIRGWNSASYHLSNPFPDDLGALASPFFYESACKDHTFFVEPFVMETAVHEWTEWVVTTSEAVYLPRLEPFLVPVNPHPIIVTPSDISVIKTQAGRYTDRLFAKEAIIRTPKGVIEPAIKFSSLATNASEAIAGRKVVAVDLVKGLQTRLNLIPIASRFGGFKDE